MLRCACSDSAGRDICRDAREEPPYFEAFASIPLRARARGGLTRRSDDTRITTVMYLPRRIEVLEPTSAPAEIVPAELTRDDITALRVARSVLFRWSREPLIGSRDSIGAGAEVIAQTEVLLDRDEAERDLARLVRSGLWARNWASEYSISFERRIGAENRLVNYGGDKARASYVNLFAGNDAAWQTIVRALRVGDSLRLYWQASNNSESTRSVGFEQDELSLIVLRGGKPAAEYLIHVYCGPNNTARMIGGF